MPDPIINSPTPPPPLDMAALYAASPATLSLPMATSPTVTAATPPALQPAYDPNSPTPYTPMPLPQTVEPVPNQLADQAQPSVQELGAGGRGLGAAAYLGNQLLRGWMQGKATADLRRAVQLHQQSTGLQSIYNDAAQQLQTMAQAGIDPNSPEFQKAQQHVQASWQSLMDFYGQHVEQPGKGKNGQLSTMQKLQQAFQSQDPAKVSSAVYEGLQQTGPPVLHQIQPYLTPAYQARVQQRAQTLGATATAAQQTAENQAELQRLLSLPAEQQTPETQDRIMQLKYGISKGTALPPTMTWKTMPGSQAFLNDSDGQWYRPQVNGIGQSRMEILPGYQPSAAELREAPGHTFLRNGVWYTYSLGRNGKPDPTTVRPLSMTAAAGPLTTTSNTMKVVQQPDGSTVLVPVQQTSTRVYGGGTPGSVPVPPAAGAQPASATPAATAAPVMPGATTPAPAPAAATVPAPAATAVAPASAVPTAAASATAPASRSIAPLPGQFLQAARAFHPTAGGARVLGPGTPVGGKLPTQELQSYHAMQDTLPVIAQVKAMLEPVRNDNGLWDGLSQRASAGLYGAGFNPGPLQTAIQQYGAFVRVAGASPWSKVGRGKYIYDQVVQHLPDPAKDTPSLMYQKLSDLQDIFQTEMGAEQRRMAAMSGGGGSKPATGAGLGNAPAPATASVTYKQTATGPGGHRIGSNDNGQTWYDLATGKQVQ